MALDFVLWALAVGGLAFALWTLHLLRQSVREIDDLRVRLDRSENDAIVWRSGCQFQEVRAKAARQLAIEWEKRCEAETQRADAAEKRVDELTTYAVELSEAPQDFEAATKQIIDTLLAAKVRRDRIQRRPSSGAPAPDSTSVAPSDSTWANGCPVYPVVPSGETE